MPSRPRFRDHRRSRSGGSRPPIHGTVDVRELRSRWHRHHRDKKRGPKRFTVVLSPQSQPDGLQPTRAGRETCATVRAKRRIPRCAHITVGAYNSGRDLFRSTPVSTKNLPERASPALQGSTASLSQTVVVKAGEGYAASIINISVGMSIKVYPLALSFTSSAAHRATVHPAPRRGVCLVRAGCRGRFGPRAQASRRRAMGSPNRVPPTSGAWPSVGR